MNTKTRIAIFASGSGTNAEEIFKYFKDHSQIEISLLLSNNKDAFALERAKKFEIPTKIFNRTQFRETGEVLQWLKEDQMTHVVLAGFMWLIPENIIKFYPDHIINIHPALLPKYGGKGMYGMKVHEEVKRNGEEETGITIHLVNEKFDDGTILFQAKCKVTASDSPQEIANKVHELEYKYYPREIEKWILEV